MGFWFEQNFGLFFLDFVPKGDGIVDFDACLSDPKQPGYLAPQYNSGDNLHPSPAGYAAMAECIDLNLFKGASF